MVGPNIISKKEYHTNRALYPLWKDGTTAAMVYWAESMDDEFYNANGQKTNQSILNTKKMQTPKLADFKLGAPPSQPYSNATGDYSQYGQIANDTLSQLNVLFGKNKPAQVVIPPVPAYIPPTYIPTTNNTPTSKPWSTGRIIGVSLAGLVVGTGIFFGLRYLFNRGKNAAPELVPTA